MTPEQARFREILADVLRSRGASWTADHLMAGDQGVILVEDALAAMQRAARIVPEGFRLVPVELTEDMAAEMECQFSTEAQWAAALAASPPPWKE